MKTIHEHLKKLRKKERRRYHPLIEIIHKKHRISRKTLFYIKEYGPHTNVSRTIIKESLKVLLFASILSSIGGLALEHVKTIFIAIMPLIILLPTLNDMFGDYGAIFSSRFATMLHEGQLRKRWWQDESIKELFFQILIISMLTAVFSSAIALIISGFSGYEESITAASKILLIAMIDCALLVSTLCGALIIAGLYFYRKGEDPNNFLIPIATSVADFGNMILLSVLVVVFF